MPAAANAHTNESADRNAYRHAMYGSRVSDGHADALSYRDELRTDSNADALSRRHQLRTDSNTDATMRHGRMSNGNTDARDRTDRNADRLHPRHNPLPVS